MNFFDKLINQLFPKREQHKGTVQPMVSEALTRKDSERKSYFEWQNSGAYKNLSGRVLQAYQDRLQEKVDDTWVIHLLQMPAANGFALTFPKELSHLEFQHFYDWLKDRVLTLNYRLVNADRQLYDKARFVEIKEKYYLKPIIDLQETNTLYNQQYGNILIEQILIDDQPSYLKFVANIYSDRLYTKALSFDDLMLEIFEVA
ncbi:MAG: hypothetical protein ACPGJS_13930 [Flammeovirgaceae bacterium]